VGQQKPVQTLNNTNTYPEVLKTMARFIEVTPRVQAGEVVNSTFHKIAAGIAA
jgi:hypothetical protein